MTPQILMKRRLNTAFLVMCLTLAVQSVNSVFSVFGLILSQMGIPLPTYYTEFVLLQFLYPISTCILVLIALRIIRIPVRSVAAVKPLKGDFIPWLGLFLGVSVGMNYAVNGLLWVLEQMGITVPGAFDSYDPQNLPQAVCYFIVLAILPPICEELLCRAGITGLLKHFHPWAAVLVSAYAFGMMHGNLQQIPFAFVLGIVLGFVYVKTGNLLYPILLHFANNAWACAMTFVSVFGGEEWTNWLGYGSDIVFFLFGIGSFVWLLAKKKFTLEEIPHSLTGDEARSVLVKTPCFWIFTGLYSGITLMNMGMAVLQETEIIPL